MGLLAKPAKDGIIKLNVTGSAVQAIAELREWESADEAETISFPTVTTTAVAFTTTTSREYM